MVVFQPIGEIDMKIYVDHNLTLERLKLAYEEAERLNLNVCKIISFEANADRVKILFDVDKVELENNCYKNLFLSVDIANTTFYQYIRSDFVFEFIMVN